MEIFVIDEQNDLIIDESSVQSVVSSVLEVENCKCDEVNIHFVSLETICQMHQDYFNDPSPTDCISFPLDEMSFDDTDGDDSDGEDSEDSEDDSVESSLEEEYKILGDVFVCPHTAIEYTQKNGGCPYEEVTLYIIHGLLHLLGHDDMEDESDKIMRIAENKHLQLLKTKNLLLKKQAKN